jgi:nucleotide-binding universal stress UspA family protein
MTQHETPRFHTIVVGYDGTTQADDALALAEHLLDREHGRLVLVDVFPFYRAFASPFPVGTYAMGLQDEARRTLELASARLGPDIRRTLMPVADSSVARAINDVAESEHADLIVLGSTHRHAVGRMAGRTTVQRLLHGAPCAVAVAVAGQREAGPVHRIGVAYDGSAEADAALHTAYELAAMEGAGVVVCRATEIMLIGPTYIVTDEDDRVREVVEERARRELDEALAQAPDGVPAEGLIVTGSAGATLADAFAGFGADLLVCGSRSYGPLHRVLAGSTALALVAHAESAVLIVPRTARPEAARKRTPLGVFSAANAS